MSFVLALIALYGSAQVTEFTDEALHDEGIHRLMSRIEMVFDPEIDEAYPARWIGLVEVDTEAGSCFVGRVDVPKGDPGNTLQRWEIEDKVRRLSAFQNSASPEEIDWIISRAWSLADQRDVRDLLPHTGHNADNSSATAMRHVGD